MTERDDTDPQGDAEEVRSVVHSAVVDILAGRIKDRRWDVEPSLWFVAEAAEPFVAEGRRFYLEEIPIPPDPQGRHPVYRLAQLAHALRVMPEDPPQLSDWERLVGVVVATEAWSLAIPADTPRAEVEKVYEWCGKHSVADHPWGVETKMVSAVDAHNLRYVSEYRRKMTGEPEVVESRDLEGRMPDAMWAVLTAFNDRIDRARREG